MSIPNAGTPVNQAARRELLINSLRLAVSRSRMQTNLLDTIFVSLKHRQVDVDGALQWARDEGVIDLIELGRRTAGCAS